MSASPIPALITLTTDFGLRDPYVAAMKGVIRAICPHAMIDDLSHAIPPQDIRATALFLSAAIPYFPPGTIHVIVVDPGVGSERLPLVIRCHDQFLVCPDNGVTTLLLQSDPGCETRIIENPDLVRPSIHPTFHGRDVFAPCAAHLAAGRPFDALGPVLAHPVRLELPAPRRDADGTLHGEIIHLDRFGNGITNIPAAWLSNLQNARVHCAEHVFNGVHQAYAQAAPGQAIALVSSTGTVEIAVREDNAAAMLGLSVGSPVCIKQA